MESYSNISIPVLFLVFNRITTTKKVFWQIKKVKPPRLYIAADGPRENILDEVKEVREVREFVLNNIDWKCEVKTLFREKNLGCGKAVSSAITWFFENEEEGIILEDDTFPSLSFFRFCEDLLKRYRNDMRVGQISGCNFQKGNWRGEGDYYFSIYNHIWGWATWRNRWEKYDFELKNINDDNFLEKLHKGTELRYWRKIFWRMKRMEIDTWDYQWTFTFWFNKWLCVLPNVNMVSNIGFNFGGTHTQLEKWYSNLPIKELVVQKHPQKLERDFEADKFTFKYVFASECVIKRVINKIRKFL
ncbi:MAG: nucleotide-diphospho-sugar transferase [Elusimicrobiota bacterium]